MKVNIMRLSGYSCMHRQARPRQQAGIVLVTALIILVVLTMLMMTTMRTGVMEERMAGNLRDWNNAFQAAEAAMRDAEREIYTASRIVGQTGFATGCSTTGLCYPNTSGEPVWVELGSLNDAGWLTGTGSSKSVQYGTYSGAAPLSGVAQQPRYIIEVLIVPSAGSLRTGFGAGQQNFLYRVTAVGFGGNVKSRVVLQAVYRQY